MRVLFSVFALIFSITTYAAERVLHVVLVRTADTNGTNASTATAANFKDQIERANVIWAGTGVRFVFDPNTDFPPIVNDTLLNHDFMLASGQSLSQSKNQEPQVNGSLHAQAKNNYVRKNYWGKLVVFSGRGDQLTYNDSKKQWEIGQRTYAYSNMIDLFVQWFQGDANTTALAHELGHHLHLGHTFGYLPKDKAEFTDLVSKGLSQWGYTKANVGNLFDGDVGSVTDTPSDPGPDLWKAITGDPCSVANQLTIPVLYASSTFNVVFNTDRRNIMSYFKDCPFADGFHVSAQQAQRARESLDYGNRQYLINQNPGFLIPQWSPNVEAVSWAPGRLDLFATGTDLKTVHKAYDSSTGWVPALQYGSETWDNMGGKIIGKPGAVSWGSGRLDVFVRGLDNHYYHKAWDQNAWYPGSGVTQWEDLGGSFAGSPVAVSWGKNRLDIFGRGFDGQLHHKWWSPQSGWGPSTLGWEAMGGKVSADPAVVSWGSSRIDIVMRGYDGAVYHKAYAGNAWYPSLTDWESLGGSVTGEPAMTAWSQNRLDIVVRGKDNAIYHKAWTGQAWYPSVTGWSSIGGAVSSNPSMTSWGPGRLDIVAAGTDGQIWSKSYQEGTGWYPNVSGWFNIGGWIMPGASPKVVSWKSGRLDIFMRSSNFEFQHKAYDSSTGWYPGLTSTWENLGKYVE